MTRIPTILLLSLLPFLGACASGLQDDPPPAESGPSSAASLPDARPPLQGVAMGDLAWLTGHWLAENETLRSEEVWTTTDGELLLGMNKGWKKDQPAATFEYLRIERKEDGSIAYHAHPRGAAGASFPLVSLDPGRAVFENPAHDFPQRITYIRKGDLLVAGVGTLEEPKMLQFRWELQGDRAPRDR